MSVHTNKGLSDRDGNQVLQSAYNIVDASITTNGFLVGQVGNKVTLAISTTTIANDTETYSFFDPNSVALYQIRIIYTDGTRATLLSAERIS